MIGDIQPGIPKLLNGRTCLVTGADGFVGSHLVEALLGYGANVHAMVRATSSGMLHNLSEVQGSITIHRGQMDDAQAVLQTLKALKGYGDRPIIFHLAAQAHVGESWARNYETIATNVLGTMNLLQCLVDLDLDVYKVDVAGSSEEFGNLDAAVREHYRFDSTGGLILDERSPLNPQSVYATSKLAADFLTRNFHSAYGLPGVVTRMFNNYGPRQSPRFITGTVITQAMERDVVRLGYVRSKRDFTFVDDGVNGHIHAALFGDPGEVYVFGSGATISIEAWAHLIIQAGQDMGAWGPKKLEAETEGRARLGRSEVEELRVDFTKFANHTGWAPRVNWVAGITKTITWFTQHRERWKTRVDW